MALLDTVVRVYNLWVAQAHTYLVGEEGLLVYAGCDDLNAVDEIVSGGFASYTNLLFSFDVAYLTNSINKLYPSYIDKILSDKFLDLDYIILYKKLIYDYAGNSGNTYKRINTYLSELSLLPLIAIKELLKGL